MTDTIVNQQLTERAREALGRIARYRNAGEKVMLDVPVLYPSGTTAVIEIELNGDKVWVADMGLGYLEAELMCATESYKKFAIQKAKEFGVEFDGFSMFALWVPLNRLEAAIIRVANASCQAATEAVRHATEAQNRSQDEAFFERVSSIFGRKFVAREAEVSGQRISWQVHNLVVLQNGRRAIFEPMTKHAASVSSKFLMFSDIRASNASISLTAVVANKSILEDPKAQMVADVANIVPVDAPDLVLREYAMAS